jgi:hypothetical protein
MALKEQMANFGTATLNGSLTDAATSVPVSSATLFPTVGDFRIIVEDEVMLVTSVSGDTLTVTRGAESTTNVAHDDAKAVAMVMTKGSIEETMKDWVNPYFNDASAYFYQLLSSTDITLDSTDFTWDNQGSASVADTKEKIILTCDSNGLSRRMFTRSYTAPWKVTVALSYLQLGATEGSTEVSLGVLDSAIGTSKNIAISGVNLYGRQWTNSTTRTTDLFTGGENYGHGRIVWFQFEDDNVDHLFRISHDGRNWSEVDTSTRTTHTATPDEIGIGLSNNTGADMICSLYAWHEE